MGRREVSGKFQEMGRTASGGGCAQAITAATTTCCRKEGPPA